MSVRVQIDLSAGLTWFLVMAEETVESWKWPRRGFLELSVDLGMGARFDQRFVHKP
jgi:hypothetical protein